MSSATSINGTDAERLPKTQLAATPRDDKDSLQPWHFFVLLSLMAATAAVVLAREARPEHLVLISLTIGGAGFAGAALYRTLAPLVGKDDPQPVSGLSESMRAVLEREKTLVLRSIKDLEFDRAMGKVSSKDFDEMAGRLRSRAMSLMRQLDTEAGYRELIERELQARLSGPAGKARRARAPQPPSAPAAPVVAGTCVCGTANDADAAFCKRCGAKLATGTGA